MGAALSGSGPVCEDDDDSYDSDAFVSTVTELKVNRRARVDPGHGDERRQILSGVEADCG